MSAQSPIDQIAQRVERLLARHDEILRANALLQVQVASLAQERDALLARFAAARMRLDAVLERLPAELSQDVFDNNSPPAASTATAASISSPLAR